MAFMKVPAATHSFTGTGNGNGNCNCKQRDQVVAHDHHLPAKPPCSDCKNTTTEKGGGVLLPLVQGKGTAMTKTEEGVPPPVCDQSCRHGHQLKLSGGSVINRKRDFFNCDGCKEPGFGYRYRCSTCNFDLHKDCYQPSLTTQRRHFPEHTFDFHLQSPTTNVPHICDACLKPIHGFFYHCKESGWDLHPCCTNLKTEILLADGSKLFLQEDRIDKKTRACFQCKNRKFQGTKTTGVPGWSYVSGVDDRCHVYCMMKRDREMRQLVENERLKKTKASEGEYWQEETLSMARNLIGFMSGDPTGLLIDLGFLVYGILHERKRQKNI